MKNIKLNGEIRRNVSLADYTTFQIGGRARYFLTAGNKAEIISAVKLAKQKRLPFFVLGGGSNLLVSDNGFNGLVIKIENGKYQIQNTRISAGAGVKLGELVNISAINGFTGLEWAAGIPGTVGGAIYGNAGAFDFCAADAVESVEVLEISECRMHNAKLKIKNFKNKDCEFNYRDSVFKRSKNLIILSVIFKFKKGKKSEIQEKIKKYLDCKKNIQPLNFSSAGSVFKNQKSKEILRGAGGEIQNLLKKYPDFKKFKKAEDIPAAWLIEKCELKGKRIGNAKISEKQANFIVNLGKAEAKDVNKLIDLIKEQVENKFGAKLEEEIQFLGF